VSAGKLNIVSGLEKRDDPEEELKFSPTMLHQLKLNWIILTTRSSTFVP